MSKEGQENFVKKKRKIIEEEEKFINIHGQGKQSERENEVDQGTREENC